MSLATRRQLLLGAAGLGGMAALAGWRLAHAQPAPQVVAVTAKRFAYSPSEIVVKPGVPVVLEVSSMDFVHGMSFPDFNVRADLVPGRVTRVELPAAKPGVYDFLCDNFCGDDHETMHGRLVVQA